jgi:hypothetical protein
VWRSLLVASLPLGLALAINELYFRADSLIISLFEPFEQVGQYTLAYRMLEFALALGSIFLTTVFPLLSAGRSPTTSPARCGSSRARPTPSCSSAPRSWPGGLVVAPQLVELVSGADFADAATPLQILLFAGAALVDQRRVRLRARGQAPPALGPVAQRHGARLQRRPEPAARAGLRHRGGRRRDRRLRARDLRRLDPPQCDATSASSRALAPCCPRLPPPR